MARNDRSLSITLWWYQIVRINSTRLKLYLVVCEPEISIWFQALKVHSLSILESRDGHSVQSVYIGFWAWKLVCFVNEQLIEVWKVCTPISSGCEAHNLHHMSGRWQASLRAWCYFGTPNNIGVCTLYNVVCSLSSHAYKALYAIIWDEKSNALALPNSRVYPPSFSSSLRRVSPAANVF